MAEVKWIKLNVGMFDGNSFKRIKNAKIGGESYRDKLTAIWFELMDFAGKCNAGGQLIESPEIPFMSLDDIAIMIDREPAEVELCMQFYIKNRMVTVIDDVYSLTNWVRYQNEDGLERIREQNRIRQANFKARKKQEMIESNASVTLPVTLGNATDIDKDKELDIDKDIIDNKLSCQQIIDLYHQICVSFPKVRVLSEARKKTIKARMKVYSIDDIKLCFEKAENSNFLKGSNDRNWSADFDWLMSDKNMAKVIDGNYDNNKSKKQGKKNVFNNFTGRSYDMGSLESQLLGCDKPIEHDNP